MTWYIDRNVEKNCIGPKHIMYIGALFQISLFEIFEIFDLIFEIFGKLSKTLEEAFEGLSPLLHGEKCV